MGNCGSQFGFTVRKKKADGTRNVTAQPLQKQTRINSFFCKSLTKPLAFNAAEPNSEADLVSPDVVPHKNHTVF